MKKKRKSETSSVDYVFYEFTFVLLLSVLTGDIIPFRACACMAQLLFFIFISPHLLAHAREEHTRGKYHYRNWKEI